VLQLNSESWRVLRSEREVKLIRPREKLAKQTRRAETDWTGADMGLFEALRKWRRDAARQHNVPPYVVLTDASLMHLAKARPTSESSLTAISGIGEKKRQMWGEAIVDQITAYCLEAGLSTDQFGDVFVEESNEPRMRRGSGAKLMAMDMFGQGRSVADIAEQIDRAPSTVAQYLEQFILETRPASVDAWVDPATYERVRDILPRVEEPGLGPIFRALDEQVPYETIRIVVAHVRSRLA
jgi:ATP-dependent DNA helicase RecQ